MPGGLAVGAGAEHAHRGALWRLARRVQHRRGLRGAITRLHGLDRHRLHHQGPVLHQKGETLAVGCLEGCAECRHGGMSVVQQAGGRIDDQRGVRAFVAHMHAAQHLHRTLPALLLRQFGLRGIGQYLQGRLHGRPGLGGQRQLHGLLAQQALVRQAHAVGRQDARHGVHQYLRHAQCIGHQAGVLAARATKTLQGVARDVVAPGNADLLDGACHLLHGNLDAAVGRVFGR